MSESNIYKHIVSFGSMCAVGIYLRDRGFRSKSTIFDWLDSNIKDNIDLVNNDFNDILDIDLLIKQYPKYKHIVTNKKYHLSFVHHFKKYPSISKQMERVTDKVNRQINSFKYALDNDALLVYYTRYESEQAWIYSHQDEIKAFLDKHHADLLIISHSDAYLKDSDFKYFMVTPNDKVIPFGGDSSWPLNDWDNLIFNYLKSHYDENLRLKNLDYLRNRTNCFVRWWNKHFKKAKIEIFNN